jgi:hypothetical protein
MVFIKIIFLPLAGRALTFFIDKRDGESAPNEFGTPVGVFTHPKSPFYPS